MKYVRMREALTRRTAFVLLGIFAFLVFAAFSFWVQEPQRAQANSHCSAVCGLDSAGDSRYYPAQSLDECSDQNASFLCLQDKKACYDYLIPRGWQNDSGCCCQDKAVERYAGSRINCAKFVGWDVNGFAVEKNPYFPFNTSTKSPEACAVPASSKLSSNENAEEESRESDPEPPDNTGIKAEATPQVSEQCRVLGLDGWLEPAQGVWQDDYIFTDKPKKRISFVSKIWPAYKAELDMVKGRDTLLFGVFRAFGRSPLDPSPTRDFITLRGYTTGTKAAKVHFRFTLGETIIYEDETEFEILLDGPCSTAEKFEAPLDASDGIPPAGKGKPFRFTEIGPYALTAELVRSDGRETGIKATAEGNVVETHGFRIHFLPAIVTDPNNPPSYDAQAKLQENAGRMGQDSALYIPDYFPLPPASIVSVERSLKNLYAATNALKREAFDIPAEGQTFTEIALAGLNDNLTTAAILGGIDRLVVVLSAEGFSSLGLKDALGFALSSKVVMLREDESYHSVAHEIAHTLPYLWSSKEMTAQCDINYHNIDDRYAFGHQIVEAGKEKRQRKAQQYSIMGPDAAGYWNDQCTYKNLLEQLQKKIDPEVVLVRGIISRAGGAYNGTLGNLYQLEGETDLAPGGVGSWSIAMKDANSRVLASYAFDPEWRLHVDPEGDKEQNLIAFAYRVEKPEGLFAVELFDPAKQMLERITFSPSAPRIEILSPKTSSTVKPKENKILLEWQGTDDDGDDMSYSVLYSPDKGMTWLDQAFEIKENSLEVGLISGAKNHIVRVIATDGAQNSEARVEFRTQSFPSLLLVSGALLILLGAAVRIFIRKKHTR